MEGCRNIPAVLPVAAVSVGVVDGEALLDLAYGKMQRPRLMPTLSWPLTADGLKCSVPPKGKPFQPELFSRMQELATKGINELFWLSGKLGESGRVHRAAGIDAKSGCRPA